MLPEAKGDDLVYAVGYYRYGSGSRPALAVFSYPQGKLVGEVSLSPNTGVSALCPDGRGDVFVPTNVGEDENYIYEYAHGGTEPIATLTDSGVPYGCAVDPATGNLAATNEYPGNVAVYPQAQGTPTYYTVPKVPPLFCAYDDAGNLFVTGNDYEHNIIAELPMGSGSFEDITVNEDIYPGSLQWHDGYLVIATYYDFEGIQNLYRVKVSGLYGSVMGQTALQIRWHNKSQRRIPFPQLWVQGSTIIGPDFGENAKSREIGLSYWHYPKGGAPRKFLTPAKGSLYTSVAFSAAPPHSTSR